MYRDYSRDTAEDDFATTCFVTLARAPDLGEAARSPSAIFCLVDFIIRSHRRLARSPWSHSRKATPVPSEQPVTLRDSPEEPPASPRIRSRPRRRCARRAGCSRGTRAHSTPSPGFAYRAQANHTVTHTSRRRATKNAPLAARARVDVLAMRGSGRIIFFGGSRDGRALDAIDGVVEAAERGANSVHVRRFGQP